MDAKTIGLVGGVLGLLALATLVGQILKRQPNSGINPSLVQSFNLRIIAWWLMCSVLAAAFWLGQTATVVLFGLCSFWALREFITLTPTRLGDHRALFWVFFLFTPLQYVLVGMERYSLYSILIPVYAFLFIPARVALAGDYKRFLERTAKIQAGLLICVYCLSYAPALLSLPYAPDRDSARITTEYAQNQAQNTPDAFPVVAATVDEQSSELPESEEEEYAQQNQNARLLFFFILVVQLSDVLQYAWGKLLGKHVIAPAISASRTWEGFLGGVGSATLVGAALYWSTPFEPWEAAGMSMVISIMGFCGGMTMSAIKRDRGVKDYGTLVEGHSGALDRIDSLCFAAPVFFHLTVVALGSKIF